MPREGAPDRIEDPGGTPLQDHAAVEQAEPEGPGQEEPAPPVDGGAAVRGGHGATPSGGGGPTSGGRRGRRGRGGGRTCTGGRPAGRSSGGTAGTGPDGAAPAIAATTA